MKTAQPNAPLCQSCAMPLQRPEDFGTAADGSSVTDYCRYCYQRGAFTDPTISRDAMTEKCVTLMAGQGMMPAEQARALMMSVLPTLKRWRQ